jgi:hypothetical protein
MPIKKPRFNWIRQRPRKAIAWLQGHEKTASWLGAAFTGLIFLVTLVYAITAIYQWRAMNATVQQTQTLIGQQKESLVYARTQADAAKIAADAALIQAKTAQEQTTTLKDSLAETRKAANAAVTQANASMSQANTSRLSAIAAKESAGTAKQALYIGERPYLTLTETSLTPLPLAAGKPLTYRVILENTGRTPAYDVEGPIYLATMLEPLPENPAYSLWPTRGSKSSVGPGKPSVTTQTVDFSLTDREIELINNGKLFLYIYGFKTYRDSFTGTLHRCKFCSFYYYKDKALKVCPQHNECN